MNRRPESICTVILIAVNIAVFLVLSLFGNTEDAIFMLKHGAMLEPCIVNEHEYYRIVTSIFLPFGISHLMSNMVMLGALGWNLEQIVGKVKFLIIYLVSGICGNLLSLFHGIYAKDYAVSAGASGAIFGLLGALLYVVIRNKGRIGNLTGRGLFFMAALSLYLGLTQSGIDNYAHIGGLISGFLLAVILYHGKKGEDNRSKTDPKQKIQ